MTPGPGTSGPPLPWRSHTAIVDDGSFAYSTRAGETGYLAALGSAIDLAIVPAPDRAAPFLRADVPVAAALDVNRCGGSRGAAAFGYSQPVGADGAAAPDCSNRDRWRDNAFYRVGGDVLFEPTDGGGTFGALGNPASPSFRRAVAATMHETVMPAPRAIGAFFLRDVASPDEIGSACVSAEEADATFGCSDTDDVSSASGSDGWLSGELSVVHAAPRPVYLDGLASYDADPAGTHHDLAETARLTGEPNVAGAACDDCFYSGDLASLAYQERSAMAVTAQHKRVIVIDEGPHGAPRYHATSSRARTTALAAIALFYDYATTYLASRSCGPVSGIAVCPEATLVFREPETTATDPETLRDAGGAYRRAFGSCLIGGVDYGPCVALVNAKPYAVVATGFAKRAVVAPATGDAVTAFGGSPGYALVVKGFALPVGFGDAAGSITFHPLAADDVDAATGRVKVPEQSGTILFASATPKT